MSLFVLLNLVWQGPGGMIRDLRVGPKLGAGFAWLREQDFLLCERYIRVDTSPEVPVHSTLKDFRV